MFFRTQFFHFISARVSTTTREPRNPQARHQCWLNEHWLLLIVFFSPLEPKIICLWNRFTFNPTTMMMATWKRALVENQTRRIKVWRDVQFWAVHFTIVSHRRRYFSLDFNQPAKSKIGFVLKDRKLSVLNDFRLLLVAAKFSEYSVSRWHDWRINQTFFSSSFDSTTQNNGDEGSYAYASWRRFGAKTMNQ